VTDLAGAALGFFLTVSILSYLIGDNLLFRVAAHLLIGVSAGYIAAVAWNSVVWPQFLGRLVSLSGWLDPGVLFLLLLTVLLIGRSTPRLSILGGIPMAFLVGLGAAVVVGGALTGTLVPQLAASAASLSPFQSSAGQAPGFDPWTSLDRIIILVGAVSTLAYFHFGAARQAGHPLQRPAWVRPWAWVGEIFLSITFGVLYAGALAATLTALIERVFYLKDILLRFLS
jgi:hypothetical protein